jgi:uncharacterized protein (UPF0297 family)
MYNEVLRTCFALCEGNYSMKNQIVGYVKLGNDIYLQNLVENISRMRKL